MFCRLVLANLPRRVTQAKFHVDCSSPDVLIQHVALEGKDGMQACLAVMGLKGPMWEEPLLPWELVFSSQVHAHLHPEADDHYVLNPQPVVGNNKALGKMSLNLTPTATSRIWWSKEGTLPYFVQGKIMGNFPWKGSVQTTGLICFLNLTFVKFHKCPPHPPPSYMGHMSREQPVPGTNGPAYSSALLSILSSCHSCSLLEGCLSPPTSLFCCGQDSGFLLKVCMETLLSSVAWLPGLGTVWAPALAQNLHSQELPSPSPFSCRRSCGNMVLPESKTKPPWHCLGLFWHLVY